MENTMTVSAKMAAVKEGRTSKTLSYYASFIALGLGGASLGPTLPGLAEHTGTNLGAISFLFIARSLGYMAGAHFGGRLYDRLPGHTVMGGVLMMAAVMLGIVPVVPLLWLLTSILFVLGMAEGGLDVGGNTLLVWVHRSEVGPYMNGLHFFFGIGSFLSPIIVAQAILRSGDIIWAYWILALLVFPVAIWVFLLPSPQESHSEEKEMQPGQSQTLLLGLVTIFLLLYVGAEVSFGGWAYTYAIRLNLADQAYAAYLTSAYWGALTVGRLLAVPLAARFRPMTLLITDLAGCVLSVGLMLLWSDSSLALWIGAVGLGASMASIFPTMITFSERRMNLTGKVTSWFFVGASLGAMLVPWLIGQLFEFVGPNVMMLAILLDLFAAVLVFGVLLFYSKQRTGE